MRRLRRDVKALREERDIAPRSRGLVRPGDGDASPGHRVQGAGRLRQRVLRVADRPPSARAQAGQALLERIRAIHERSRGIHGAPRIHAELAAEGLHVGRKRVARLMQAAAADLVGLSKQLKTTCHGSPRVLHEPRFPPLATQYAPGMQPTRMRRREFLVTASRAVLFASLAPSVVGAAASEPTAARLPRWRGFNLLEKYTAGRRVPFRESDFEWLAEWGFDFVRLPLSYHTWAKPDDWLKLDEAVLKEIDDAVDFGRRHSVHVNINLHRAPGYCVNPPKEPLSLWEHDEALEACAFHWAHFAKRYRGIPSSRVSFDLLNEPPDIPVTTYVRVVRRLVEAIRAEDPGRLIVADGLRWGRDPVPGLVELHIAQSTRGYEPMAISHYRASWIGAADQWPEPTWPLKEGDRGVFDKERLRRERIQPWQAIERRGVGVHVGEWGAFRHTPHRVVLAWMKDCLELWRQAGWGWALWNFRGAFGILDSGRKDVAYEEFRGHQLDRQMLDLLRET